MYIPPINTATVQHLARGQNGYGLGKWLTEDEPRRSSLAVLQVPKMSLLNRGGGAPRGCTFVELQELGKCCDAHPIVSVCQKAAYTPQHP